MEAALGLGDQVRQAWIGDEWLVEPVGVELLGMEQIGQSITKVDRILDDFKHEGAVQGLTDEPAGLGIKIRSILQHQVEIGQQVPANQRIGFVLQVWARGSTAGGRLPVLKD